MTHQERQPQPKKIFTTSWAAFYLYYVAIAICWFGPQLNPEFAARIFLSPTLGMLLGLILLGAVLFLRFGQHFEMDAEGVRRIQRYPAREELLRWHEIRAIAVCSGLTQTLLRVGDVVIQPHEGENMVWYGLESPKAVKNLLERGLHEFTAR
ncbi:MAG: hypothetical protein ACUVRZ_02120 [Desulfobacca sp.]|uniref:hypothetical protein n=1 Tax=Desulfobacca sp. TaxID=2067990 RepID=UPI0040496BF8